VLGPINITITDRYALQVPTFGHDGGGTRLAYFVDTNGSNGRDFEAGQYEYLERPDPYDAPYNIYEPNPDTVSKIRITQADAKNTMLPKILGSGGLFSASGTRSAGYYIFWDGPTTPNYVNPYGIRLSVTNTTNIPSESGQVIIAYRPI
jgi:hypothetical protein